MPRYIEVMQATTETATKVLALRRGTRRGTRRDIQVTTEGGRTASVSWNDDRSQITLNMPSLPPDAVLTRAEADRLVAFIGHECCHVLHSNQDAWQRACAAGSRVRDWTNALEDVRIERTEIKAGAFPALQGLLAGMANHLHYEAVTGRPEEAPAIGSQVADAPYVAAILGRMANGYAIPAAGSLAGGLSPQVRGLIDTALAGIRQCKSTDDVVALAARLAGTEQALAPPNQPGQGEPQDGQGEPQDGQGEPQDGQGEPQDGQDGQDGQGEPQDGQGEPQDGQDGQDGQGEPQDGQDGQGEPQDGQDGQDGQGEPQDGQDGQDGQGEPQDGQDGQGEPQDGQDGQGAGSGIPTDIDLSDVIDAIAKRAGIAKIDNHDLAQRSYRLAMSKATITAVDALGFGPVHQKIAADMLNIQLPRNSLLHGQIGRLLVSAEVRRQTHHESSGRLDRRALVRMRVGATDVYSRRDDTPGVDTALLILVDCSTSMRAERRMAIAQTAAWHIARAAESANAKVCVAGFVTAHNRRGAYYPDLVLAIIKPWEVPIADCAAQLTALSPDGGTPLSAAIWTGARMLAEVNATRHILMALTDGECDLGADGVTRACRLAEDLGVEAVGIGMNCAEVTAAFPPRYSVNVRDLSHLAERGLGALVAMLEDANPRGGGND